LRRSRSINGVVLTNPVLRIGALIALRGSPALGGTRAAAPFAAPLTPLAAFILRWASDRFLLTKPNTSYSIELPASLRSDGVRDHPGMPFGFIQAFGRAAVRSKAMTGGNALPVFTSRS